MSRKNGFRLWTVPFLAIVGFSMPLAVMIATPADASASSRHTSAENSDSANPGQLLAVSCTGPTSCVAVGTASGQTLVESRNGGQWSIVPSPNVGDVHSSLDSVSCTSTNSCMAAGVSYTTASAYQTLVESWNGTVWSVVPNPVPKGTDSNFNGVSCRSSTSCFAVGYYHDSSGEIRNLIESWNGSAWSVSPTLSTEYNTSFLASVSCGSTTACKAVGFTQECPPQMGCLESEILVASWNGTTWSVDAVPNENATDGLASVDCTSTTSCVAIGGFYDGSTGISKSLVESWNGTDWSAIYGPNPGPQSSGYTSVNCNSLADCIGVGDIFNPSAGVQEQTLAATWNGAALSVVPSPDPSTTFDELDGLSCVGSNDCVAVGYSKSPSVDQTLIESWDGTTWSVVPGPGTGVEITTTSLPDGTTGIAYAATLTATGGNPPYSWRVVSGSKLPRGLRLNKATGQIYGTPKRVGSYSFAIEVRDTKTATKPHLRTFATTTLSITVSQD